jgi:hypothetical protein
MSGRMHDCEIYFIIVVTASTQTEVKRRVDLILSHCRGLPATGCVAAYTRKMKSRYSQLCGTASDAEDAVRSAILKGFKF